MMSRCTMCCVPMVVCLFVFVAAIVTVKVGLLVAPLFGGRRCC
jgi:hypothetical protein